MTVSPASFYLNCKTNLKKMPLTMITFSPVPLPSALSIIFIMVPLLHRIPFPAIPPLPRFLVSCSLILVETASPGYTHTSFMSQNSHLGPMMGPLGEK